MQLFCTKAKSVGSFRVDFASISHGFRLHFAYVSQDSQKLKLPSLSNRPPKAAGRGCRTSGLSDCIGLSKDNQSTRAWEPDSEAPA